MQKPVFQLTEYIDLRGENIDKAERWANFEKHAGVYLFISVDQQITYYIGKSDTGVGGRLYQWLYKNNKMTETMKHEDLILVASMEECPYMTSSLETYMIKAMSPTANRVLRGRSRI